MVHVVDDDPAVRDSLRFMLETAGLAVRTHEDAMAFLRVAEACLGCVLTDVRMPGLYGPELQRRLRAADLRIPVIVMTGQAEIPMAVAAMRDGAVDFLEKPFDVDTLLDAVRRALAQDERLRHARSTATEAVARLASLPPREREVLDLLVAGMPNKAIGQQLGASPRTVEVHRFRIHEKLGARNLPDLVRLVLAPNTLES
jgi:two-component system response regulator FixJ